MNDEKESVNRAIDEARRKAFESGIRVKWVTVYRWEKPIDMDFLSGPDEPFIVPAQ